MSENLTGLFNETNKDAATSSVRSLAGTAQLTNMSTAIANDIIKKIEADFENYKDLVNSSKASHDAMDKLIKEAYCLTDADIEFLKELDEPTIDGMLKSQQSKRSRAKSKVMTLDNYRTLMTAGIAENLIRLATGKDKQAGTSRRGAGNVEFTDDEIAAIANDPERLRREIRNIQSKKSIMKSKEGFSVDSDAWQALLVIEAQLKGLRGDTTRTIVVDETKNALNELLAGVDIQHLKPADAKKLIEQAAALIANNDEEVNTDESNV